MLRQTKAERAESKARAEAMLREYLKPGDPVYSIVRSVARSGMSRTLSLYAVHDGQPIHITNYAAEYLGHTTDNNGYLRVSGTGMDMCFATVYALASGLFRGEGEPGREGYLLRSEVL
jgi:hypothetical protein